MWELEKAEGFENCFKKFVKKHAAEARAVMSNLATFHNVINETNRLESARLLSFVRKEPDGIIALDTRGAPKTHTGTKLKVTRLYVYIIEINSTIYLLRIGDKDSQVQDLKTCKKMVKKLGRSQ